MATFLLTWELGGGLGHLGRLRPVSAELRRRGHRVVLASSDLAGAARLMPDVPCLPAPIHIPGGPQLIAQPSTFADILHNAGCCDPAIVSGLVHSWRTIFDLVQPRVVVMDFSPFALLSLQNYPARAVLLGAGHSCPPDVTPLPDMCPWRDNYPDRLRATEAQVLTRLNDQLHNQGAPSLERVGELYTRLDGNLLATFRELDHYPDRVGGKYFGMVGQLPGESPEWPDGLRPRVFVYLKPTSSCRSLLSELSRRGLATLAFMPSRAVTSSRPECATLKITNQPLAIEHVAANCDLALLNAGHNTLARLLVAGKPVLALPISGEQENVANNAVRIGAAIKAAADRPEEALPALDGLLTDSRYRVAAQEFARKYGAYNPQHALTNIVDRLEHLAAA